MSVGRETVGTRIRAHLDRSSRARKIATYLGGSVVATVCSELTLVVLYGLLDVPPSPAALVAWLAGAVPNYWLNRRWTWRRRGRPSVRRELVPYAAIIGITLLLATLATKGADLWLRHLGLATATRTALVAATFLGVYVVMFGLRFVLLDRLFGRLARATDPVAPPRSRTQPQAAATGTSSTHGS
ncbi:MAG: GtrA family protein [Nocardioides sp.]|uniref:GtrA family protein n=1 Tax=Nocardioides sp. TaxID=35761 RepID=UPI0039E34EDD